MRKRASWIGGSVLGLVLLLCGGKADGVITAKLPLNVIVGYNYVLVGKVEKFFPEKPAMVVSVTEDIRGKAPFRLLPISCKVPNAKVAKENQIEPLMKRLGPDLDIIFFIKSFGKIHTTFAFTNGTWFQIQGTQDGEKGQVVFALISAEPYLRRTFKGTTEELRKLLKDHVAGKGKLPDFDEKVEPGFGPEYMPKKSRVESPETRAATFWLLTLDSRLSTPTHLFAVIPTVGLGAPLAILALLFPAVFGGVFVLFRQWMAFITLISINSMLMILHGWLAPSWPRGIWWNTDAALWFLMTLATLACTLWAWRRQLNFLFSGEHEAPKKTEHSVLLLMTGCCLLATALMWFIAKPSWVEVGWALTVVMTIGIVAGTAYKLGLALQRFSSPFAAPSLATEGIILGAMLLGHLAFAPMIWGGNLSTDGSVQVSEQANNAGVRIGAVEKKWDFTMDEKGLFVSSPLVDGDAVFAAAAHPSFRGGTLVCLDRHTGRKKWEFIDDGGFKQMISSPCLADGKLYIGEGFHDDPRCKLYCIDAATGKKHWDFTTGGQTESSPIVAVGKVYFGAGNEGVYCLDAKTGSKIWQYPAADYQGRLLRFGAGMCVANGHLYCGSGVDRNQKGDKGEMAVFCLDAATGKLLWKVAAPYPVWSTPVVQDGFVYVATGNGDIFADEENDKARGGALLCLDAESGKEKWRFKVDNGILAAPAIDEGRVYFGCRDGQLYCVGRADGKERWRRFLHSPIIATPVLDIDAKDRTVSVFAAATGGMVCCLNPLTGENFWTFNLTEHRPLISASPRLVVTPTPEGTRRQFYCGAGLGGAFDITAHRPVFYCLEDTVKVEHTTGRDSAAP